MRLTALVVGGAGGIGRACADDLVRNGFEVLLLDRALGHDACDPAAVAEVLSGVSSLQVVVHAAGSVGSGAIEDLDLVQWRKVLDDNLTSAAVVCQAASPLLGQGSSVVLFSSVNGRHGGNTLSGPAYAVAKAGVIGLTRHLARLWAVRGIRVNAVAPGPVATPMVARLSATELSGLLETVPLGRVAAAEEIAGTVAWLCSAAAASVTGTVVDVNGGAWMG